MKRFAGQFAIVFLLWTVIAIVGAAADYWLLQELGKPAAWWHLLRRPLTEQWIWAALTPLAFVIARRFPLNRPFLAHAAAVHVCGFLALCVLHCALAELVSSPFAAPPVNYHGSMLKLRFLEEFYSDIWMYWPLVCIQALLDSHARTRERERRASELETLLAGSQLALLRAQIQPHFLFNTLHAVSALARVDADGAQDMLADLAAILRTSFTESGSQETSLRQELDLVCCYLRIQGRRFGERLQVRFQIDPESLDAAVPALVLQSLVENAVVHGIAPISRCGTVSVRSFRRAERLVLQVDDDGAGLGSHHSPGVGLANARRRLQCLYGAAQSLEVSPAPGAGTSAAVSFPFHIHASFQHEEPRSDENPDADRGRRAARAATSDIAAEP